MNLDCQAVFKGLDFNKFRSPLSKLHLTLFIGKLQCRRGGRANYRPWPTEKTYVQDGHTHWGDTIQEMGPARGKTFG